MLCLPASEFRSLSDPCGVDTLAIPKQGQRIIRDAFPTVVVQLRQRPQR